MNPGWAAVLIWFSASLLSQAIYIGFNGMPYDAQQLLTALGPAYWGLVVFEVVIWITFGVLLTRKVRDKWFGEEATTALLA